MFSILSHLKCIYVYILHRNTGRPRKTLLSFSWRMGKRVSVTCTQFLFFPFFGSETAQTIPQNIWKTDLFQQAL